jgi:hypothetical protein
VVVLEFFFFQSEHCMHVAQVLNKLNLRARPGDVKSRDLLTTPAAFEKITRRSSPQERC